MMELSAYKNRSWIIVSTICFFKALPRNKIYNFIIIQPVGRGCFSFKSNVMQHGFYQHIEVPKMDMEEEIPPEEEAELEGFKLQPVWRPREVGNFFITVASLTQPNMLPFQKRTMKIY